MPRKLTGKVEQRGDRFIASLAGRYVGSFDSQHAAEEANAAEILLDAEVADKRAFCKLAEAYILKERAKTIERVGHAHWFDESDMSIWRRYIRTAPFYRKRADKIERDEIAAHLYSILGSQAVRWDQKTKTYVETGKLVGRTTFEKVRGRLHHFFKLTPGIKINPAADIPLPNIEGVKRRSVEDDDHKPHLHLDEIDRLFALPIDVFTPLHRAAYSCGIYGGLRPGEIAGLEWPHVWELFSDDSELRIRNSWDGPTKTKGSQRNIPMLPQLATEMKGYIRWLGVRPIQGYVFPGPDGGVRFKGWDADWYDYSGGNPAKGQPRRRYQGVRTLAQIRPHIQWKHVRHTCATHLMKGNFTNGHEWPDEKVAQLLGHDGPEVTRGNYLSKDADHLRRELKKGAKAGSLSSAQSRLLEALDLVLVSGDGAVLAALKEQLKKPR